MNYELAKQLKDAGFPQVGRAWLCAHGYHYDGIAEAALCTDERFYAPTLEELIEACGPGFRELKYHREAVAYLWLSIQSSSKKD